MKIVCLGGGPAGLYFSILAKKSHPAWDISVIERNQADSTFGWGVVFSDKTMAGFAEADAETHAAITQAFRHWDDIDVFFKGRKLTSSGHGFSGIARMKLLQILQQRAAVLGVKLVSLSLRTLRTEFEPDRGACFACARCFRSCPQELVRAGLMPAGELPPPTPVVASTT